MNTLFWVVAGLFAYWLIVLALRNRGLLPAYVGTQGPILTVHTQRGKALLDRLARRRRLWRAWGNFGIGIALVIMTGTFLLLIAYATTVLQEPPQQTAVNQPQNVLVIPGVNEFLPLSVAPEIIFGLFVGLVVHEGGHGLLCRVEDIEIESMGVALFTIIPIGAFVEPNEESQKSTDRGGRTRMFAAGVTNNFLVTAVAFALLFGPVLGSITVAGGAAIGSVPGSSPAAEAGIEDGDLITAVDGRPVESNEEFRSALESVEERNVEVTLADGRTTEIERSLLVAGVVPESPFTPELAPGESESATITAVNGTEVHTQAAFERELADRPVATLTTADGNEVTAPVGALVRVQSDGPAAAAGLPADEYVVITAIDGERVTDREALSDVLDGYEPGEQVTVETADNGSMRSDDVTLGEGPSGNAIVGVLTVRGYSGLVVSDVGADLYPAGEYLGLLKGGAGGDSVVGSFVRKVGTALVLPVAGVALGTGYNFPGFVPTNSAFYTVDGPLAALGGGVFVLANVLFWTGWINLNLGFFNCIPAFPLDGGHILRMSAEAVVARLPVENGRKLTTTITTSVGLLMLVSLLLMLFGPQLLS